VTSEAKQVDDPLFRSIMENQFDLLQFSPQDISDSQQSMYELIEQYRRKLLLKPEHQRDFIWTKDKIANWINRIKYQNKPLGTIATYELIDGKISPIFLNDGFQRLTATMELLDHPEKYGFTTDTVVTFLMRLKITVQHRHYKNHDEALMDFQLVNMGTHLTPYEHCWGILTYMNNSRYWLPLIENAINAVEQEGKTIARGSSSRDTSHKLIRSSLALLHRFINKPPNFLSYKISNGSIPYQDIQKKQIIEWYLRNDLDTIDLTEGKQMIDNFIDTIKRESGLIRTIWIEELHNPIGRPISAGLYRFLLDLAIYRRYSPGITVQDYYDFAKLLMYRSNGMGGLSVRDEEGRDLYRLTFKLSDLAHMSKVCEMIGSDIWEKRLIKKVKHVKLLPGFDNSHLVPLSQYGDGATIPEPASLNRARGAKPIET